MSKRRKIAIAGLAMVVFVATALFLGNRLSAGGPVPPGGWHYDQLLVYTKMSTASQNTNPVLRDLYIFDTANNTEKKLPGISTGAVGKIAYSPATRTLAYSRFALKADNTPNYNSCTLELYDVSTFKKLSNLGPSVNKPSGCAAPFSWSPDGSIMIFKHIIDYDYGNIVTRYMVLNNSLLNKKRIIIKKIGILSPDGYQDIDVDIAFGWYGPQAFVAVIRSPELVKVTFPAPLYVPVIKSIDGTGFMFGKVVFDASFRRNLLYSLFPRSFPGLNNRVTFIPFAGGAPTVMENTKNVANFIMMKYGVDQNGGMIKELVYRQYKSPTDPENGFYTIDPNTGAKTFIDGANLFGSSVITDFLSFDSGPGNRFYYRLPHPSSRTSGYMRQSAANPNERSEVVVQGLSENEL